MDSMCFELGKLIDRFQHNYENTTNYRNYRNPIMYMLVPWLLIIWKEENSFHSQHWPYKSVLWNRARKYIKRTHHSIEKPILHVIVTLLIPVS